MREVSGVYYLRKKRKYGSLECRLASHTKKFCKTYLNDLRELRDNIPILPDMPQPQGLYELLVPMGWYKSAEKFWILKGLVPETTPLGDPKREGCR